MDPTFKAWAGAGEVHAVEIDPPILEKRKTLLDQGAELNMLPTYARGPLFRPTRHDMHGLRAWCLLHTGMERSPRKRSQWQLCVITIANRIDTGFTVDIHSYTRNHPR